VGVVVTVGAGLYEPGHVQRTDDPERIGYRVGEVHGRVTPRIRRLAEALSHAAKTVVTTNLWGERWAKLAINCMANPIAGLTGLGSAASRQHPETRRLAIHIAAEVVRVGEALGYQVEPIGSIPAPMIREAAEGKGVEEVEMRLLEDARRSGEGRPSLLQDILKGRRTEIDHLNGLVARLGAQVGIPTPLNSAIVPLVKEVERGVRRPSLENLSPLLALLPQR
jgi:2-dehydropantoate 2-reductase